MVGDVLDLGGLVVVRQEDGVLLGGEPADLGPPVGPVVVRTSRRCGGRAGVAVTGPPSSGVSVLSGENLVEQTLAFPSCPPSGPHRNVRPIRTTRWPSCCRSGAGGCT